MKKIVLLVLTSAMLSCLGNDSNSNEKGDNTSTTIVGVKKTKQLVVEIDLEMSKPEDIKLLAVNTFLNNGKYIDIFMTQKVNANENSKTIRFEMPENITPDNYIGISFGKKYVKEVKVNSINWSFDDLNYNVTSDKVLDFFNTNKYLDYDEEAKVFKTKMVDQMHNPILFLRKIYVEKIEGIR